jgi:hypothetical protein
MKFQHNDNMSGNSLLLMGGLTVGDDPMTDNKVPVLQGVKYLGIPQATKSRELNNTPDRIFTELLRFQILGIYASFLLYKT